MTNADVVIVGGGVIGLSIAYALAREGVSVTVLDRAEPGRAASWAGAGIIAPGSDREIPLAMARLRTRSARLFPGWSQALLDETGIDNGYRRCGGVDVAFTPEQEQALRAAAGRWKLEGITFERLEPCDFERVEPALNPDLRVAYFLPDRAQIRNPRHLKALIVAGGRRGVRIIADRPVTGFDILGGRVHAVQTVQGPLPCGQVVVSAGAWSGELLGGLGLRVQTPPIKGEIVLLKTDRPILRRIIELGSRYLVPRDDGRVLVGATEEEVGFDTRSTPAAVRDLLDFALRLCPALAASEVETSWAGLRPGSLDTRPYIGPAPGYENLFVATGHRRAGLQLSTATAEVVADLLLGRPPSLDLSDFRLDRPAGAGGIDDPFRS
ncbi:glycine oxidase ThiO [soil metagenome]